jgi:hypothetical protein
MAEPKRSNLAKVGSLLANPVTGSVLSSVGGYIGGSADRGWRDWNREQADKAAGRLKIGITEADITQLLPLFRKSVLPYIRQMAGSASAKFGSRSGYATGAAISAADQAMAPYVSEAMLRRLTENQQNFRTLFAGRMSGAQAV